MIRPSFALAGLLALLSCQGCSVYLAAAQPDRVDVAALRNGGMPRELVIARLGAPTSSTRTPDGRRTDLHQFYEGSATGWKVGRATFHLVADVFTVGLWEVVATPMEIAIRGSKITARVDYDRDDSVVAFTVLSRKASERQQTGHYSNSRPRGRPPTAGNSGPAP